MRGGRAIWLSGSADYCSSLGASHHPAMMRACATRMLAEAPRAITAVRGGTSWAMMRMHWAMNRVTIHVGVMPPTAGAVIAAGVVAMVVASGRCWRDSGKSSQDGQRNSLHDSASHVGLLQITIRQHHGADYVLGTRAAQGHCLPLGKRWGFCLASVGEVRLRAKEHIVAG